MLISKKRKLATIRDVTGKTKPSDGSVNSYSWKIHSKVIFDLTESCSLLLPIILAIFHEIMQHFANFSLTIMKNSKNYHSRISRFTQIVKREITFMLF